MLPRNISIAGMCLLALNMAACTAISPSPAPTIGSRPASFGSVNLQPSTDWSLSNFRPSNDTVLIDGIVQAYSVDIDYRLQHDDDDEYYVFFSAHNQNSQPAKLSLTSQGGEAEVHETLTWSARSHGREQVTTVALYKKIEAGTQGFISLSAMQNRYSVICNNREFILSLLIKRALKYCVYGP